MGIAPYKTFTFDGESSADYGVYITGTGVFNAPERSVEMIDIPSRNGAYALDRGRFENIEVTYNVGIVDDNEADFADRVSDFRNWLCSKVGYCRLEDEYNPNEYRMALFSSGVEIDHDLLIAGEAEITFNCKPQRWLKSGETAVTVADGGTVDNPTLFDSSPLLEVYGSGEINIDEQKITVESRPIGYVKVFDGKYEFFPSPATLNIDTTFANNGDKIVMSRLASQNYLVAGPDLEVPYVAPDYDYVVDASVIAVSGDGTATARYYEIGADEEAVADLHITVNPFEFNYGIAKTLSTSAQYRIETNNGHVYTDNYVTLSVAYDGDSEIVYTETVSHNVALRERYPRQFQVGKIYLDSTKSALGNPLYIDLDIGEAYNTDYGEPISVNDAVQLPSDLPTLKPGTNTINYDNTFTQVDIVPRWWKV